MRPPPVGRVLRRHLSRTLTLATATAARPVGRADSIKHEGLNS